MVNRDGGPQTLENVATDHTAKQAEVIFTFAWETIADVEDRRWSRPPDRLIREFLGDPRIGKLMVAEPPRNPLVSVARSRGHRSLGLPPATVLEGRRFVSFHHFGARRPMRPRRRILRYGEMLHRAAAEQGMARPVIVTTDPRVAGFCDLTFAERVVYFARDDWASHPAYHAQRSTILAAYDEMRRRGTDVVAVSDTLLDRITTSGRSQRLPNGVDPAEWLAHDDPPTWFEALPGPRLVYVGSLDTRLDVEWLESLSRAFSSASIVLVGPFMDREVVKTLAAIPGVVLPGLVGDRRDVAAIVRAADVALLPHVVTDLTQAMDPLKLYEYLAAGRPVVATDLTPIRGIDRRIIITSGGADAARAVGAALELGPANDADRRAFIDANSWSARANALFEFMRPSP